MASVLFAEAGCSRMGFSAFPDSCENVDCGQHGECVLDNQDQPVCLCDPGYTRDGFQCVQPGGDGGIPDGNREDDADRSPEGGEPDGGAPDGDEVTDDGPSVVPSNVGDRLPLDASSTELVVGEDEYDFWVINTDDGSITAYTDADIVSASSRTVREPGLGDVGSGVIFTALPVDGERTAGVLSLGRLEVRAGAELVGIGLRPLVLLVADEVLVAGTLNVGADTIPGQSAPGPSGFRGKSITAGEGPGGGAAGDYDGHNNDGGGGGGGHASRGGNGGGPLGDGGAAYELLAPTQLIGGSGGGGSLDTPSPGGHGGGALQITAATRIRLELGGAIDACGGGAGPTPYAGGGGGAGGFVLLEAPVVELEGAVGANGGAGARGRDPEPAARGRPDLAPVLGRPRIDNWGAGGNGSDPDGVAGHGDSPGSCGGGGGGAGRVRIHTSSGQETFPEAVILPTLSSGVSQVDLLLAAP